MKILVVSQYYYPEPFRITDICEELVKRGHSITVLTGLPNYPEGKILKEYKNKSKRNEIRNGVKIIRTYQFGRGRNKFSLLLNYFSFPFFANRTINKIEKDFDIVFINQLSPVMMSLPGIKYAKKYRKKCILYCYDLWPASLVSGGIREGSLLFRWFSKLSKKIYNGVDKILCTSKSFLKYFEQYHYINKDRLYYLPQYAEDLFDGVGIQQHDELNLLFAGNIGKTQSVITILKAANLLKANENIKFHIVGDGRDLCDCKEFATKNKLDNVIFYGRKPIDMMPFFYSISDIMLVSMIDNRTISMTLPGKVQSYMLAGKPIIACANGETKRIISEAKCGVCFNSGDFDSLAQYLISFNKTDLERFSKNSKQYYEENFSKDRFFSNLISFLKYE